MPDRGLGVYVHVPFCRERCSYCDFAIVTGRETEAEAWAEGIAREAQAAAARHGRRRVATVHFGGGTPSRIASRFVDRVLRSLAASFDLDSAASVSLEANAEDVTHGNLADWRTAGISRLSIGVQSLRDEGLEAIGRPGRASEGRAAVRRALDAGFESVSADFIYGWPGQDVRAWRTEISEIVALGLQHVSLYGLELTGRTPLVRAIERGDRQAPDEDAQASMYELACSLLPDAGLEQYEISNFAAPGHRSDHNLLYWTDGEYLGLGPSAAGYVDGERRKNPAALSAWQRQVERGVLPGECEPYDADRRCGEAIVFGLRLVEGVDLGRVSSRHGQFAVDRRRDSLRASLEAGLLRAIHEQTIALTPRGRLLANEVCRDLI